MVAMNVWPTDAADGAVTSEARWRKMARMWAPSGVAAGVAGELAPSLAFPNLTVQAGSAWVDGHFTELTGSQVLTVTANGIVVVRFDPAANTAELLYRDGVSTPTQNPTGTWELLIAQISGSALSDRRTFASTSPLVQTGAYTPVLSNMGVGSGGSASNAATWTFVGGDHVGDPGLLVVSGRLIFGTTGATFPQVGAESISLPPGFLVNNPSYANVPVGQCLMTVGGQNCSAALWRANATSLRPVSQAVTGTNVIWGDPTATVPFAWAAGDLMSWTTIALQAVRA